MWVDARSRRQVTLTKHGPAALQAHLAALQAIAAAWTWSASSPAIAQRRWPDVQDRRQLLLRLVQAGRESLEREASEREAAVSETAGSLTGVYESGELARVREDWPA